MLPALNSGRFRARLAASDADLRRVQDLRGLAFLGPGQGPDIDKYDPSCDHILVEETASARVMCSFRLFMSTIGRGAADSYSAQFFDLAKFAAMPGPMAEIGRLCLRPGLNEPDILRMAWAALIKVVASRKIQMLFGCSSFAGTNGADYWDAFAMLKQRYLAPDAWMPGSRATQRLQFQDKPDGYDACRANAQLPPLLRTYLAMGGRVGDHAAVDTQMNTLVVFTGLEIAAIPLSRARHTTVPAGLVDS